MSYIKIITVEQLIIIKKSLQGIYLRKVDLHRKKHRRNTSRKNELYLFLL